MKILIVFLLFASTFLAQAQTNRTVMVDTNGVIQRPTNFITTNRIVSVGTNGVVINPSNFWTLNSSNINNILTNEVNLNFKNLFSKSRFVTTFFGVSTLLTNINVNNFPAFFEMWTSGTNVTASGQAMLMRGLFSTPYTGTGLQFGTLNYQLVIDATISVGSTNNIVRYVIGNGFTDANSLTTNGIGFEVSQLSSNNIIRIIARNETNNIFSDWISIPVDRTIFVLKSKTNGELSLFTSSGNLGDLPTLKTNISGGPTNTINVNNANLNVGIFIIETNQFSRNVTTHGASFEIVDYFDLTHKTN